MSPPATRIPWFISSFANFLVTTVGGATLYLVLFNRKTRQGVHDLVVGSYIADADKNGPLKIEPIWKPHWVILSSLLVILFVGTGVLGDKLGTWGAFPQLLEDVRLVEEMKGVQVAGVQDLTSWSDNEKKKVLVVNIHWIGRSENEPAFADQVAKVILEHDSTAKQRDSLKVVMIRGYSLGIAHAQVSHYYQHTPVEWNARLELTDTN